MEYHKDIQGLIYGLLRGSQYNVHDKSGYKFFSFSNVFPWGNIRKNDVRNLMIASPNNDFISYVKEQLEYLPTIRVGAMQFKFDYCNKLDIRLPNRPFSLITATPILCNIQRYRFEEANALDLVNGFKSTYWRVDHPVDLFLKQVEANLVKKYNSYHEPESPATRDTEHDRIFYKSRFLKQVAIPLSMGQDRYKPTVIGTNWLFGFTDPELAKFALDAGLGELNSLGFGFMNVQRLN
jgi:CRISPR-associated endoribonuclease Cas6